MDWGVSLTDAESLPAIWALLRVKKESDPVLESKKGV